MKDWYLRQSPRDRMIVLIVGALVLVSLAYAVLWYPVTTRVERATRGIESRSETLAFLEQAAPRLRASAGSGPVRQQSDKQPYLLIDEIIRKAGISQPERVEPSGADGARVQFKEVSFDGLVRVLAELETYGLVVATMNLSRKNEGTVSARFNMERG